MNTTKTIKYFEEISQIPRESGNEENIANYIVEFAKERNLEYKKDKYNNVIIKKYINDEEPIILQAHLDMVCEKENNLDFDFKKEPINLIYENDFIKAKNTTLGADNGIGVAQILNILDSDIERNIEAIFTTCEETTMNGAEQLDLSTLKGKKMINLDGFNSNTILLESASFTDIDIITKYQLKEKSTTTLYKIKISGLKGGHSGFDIDKKRGNAIILLAKLLLEIKEIRLASFNGGTKINVIPSMAEAIIETKEDIYDIVTKYQENQKKKYNNLNIDIEKISESTELLSKDKTIEFLTTITKLKHGVNNKNSRNEVTTSQNLALVNLSKNLIQIGLRSSKEKEEQSVINKLKNYCEEYNYQLKIIGHQPGFTTSEKTELVEKMKESYYKLHKKYPNIKSVHIAVEVGIIKEKIKDLDVVIISPEIIDAHTPKERVKISSIIECDNWLLEFLKSSK